MIIEKIFCRQLTISDPKVIYEQTPFIDFLNKCQIGFCADNSFILEIKSIIKRTPMIVNIERCGGLCNVNVEFSANVLVYDQGEIIPAAKVVKVDEKNDFTLTAPNTSIYIPKTGTLLDQHINVGADVPIRVEYFSFNYHSSTVSVIGSFLRPWTPPPSPPIASSNIVLKMPAIAALMTEIKELQAETESKTYDVWKQILSGNKKKSKGFEITDKNLPKIVNCNYDSMWELMLVDDGKETKTEKNVVFGAAETKVAHDKTQDAIIISWLNTVKKNLVAMRDIGKKYKHDTSESYIWAFYIGGVKGNG